MVHLNINKAPTVCTDIYSYRDAEMTDIIVLAPDGSFERTASSPAQLSSSFPPHLRLLQRSMTLSLPTER